MGARRRRRRADRAAGLARDREALGRSRRVAGRARRAARAAGADRTGRPRRPLDPRAVVAAKLAGGVRRRPGRSARRPGARREARDRGVRRPRGRRVSRPRMRGSSGRRSRAGGGSSPRCPTPSTCSRSGPRPGATQPAAWPRSQRPAPPGPLTGELARTVAEVECGRPLRDALAALRAPRPRGRGRGAGGRARALAHLRLAARRAAAPAGDGAAASGAAADRGPRGALGAEDPARRRARPRALGPVGARRRAGRPLGRTARPVLSRR